MIYVTFQYEPPPEHLDEHGELTDEGYEFLQIRLNIVHAENVEADKLRQVEP